jgi:serine/threonine protein kinase
MSVALKTVVDQLTDSGIVTQRKLENFIPPKAHPKSVEELVAELVKQNQLTKFQARQVAAGKAKSLIVGGYTIVDKIGAGGMGQVFKAHHRRMDRIVAVKVLPSRVNSDPAAIARFEREAKAAAKLLHPNIVTAFDADQANGIHFLVMEYVEGRDLSRLVKKNGPFPVGEAANYVLQAARGLEYAHKHGVIHRDMKPANLLLTSEGTIKILDLGLARIDSDNGPDTADLTGTKDMMGTIDYMAPEQALKAKYADARADIYSLGCTLYYLIAGKAAYQGETMMAKLLAHREDSIPSLKGCQSDVSDELEAVFTKMVAKQIEDRYQTMNEVIAGLERLQSPDTISPRRSSETTLDESALTFLKTIASEASSPSSVVRKSTATKIARPDKTRIYAASAAAVVSLTILAAVVWRQTNEGTSLRPAGVPARSSSRRTASAPNLPSVNRERVTPTATASIGEAAVIDPDRKAAEWVLSLGGTVKLKTPATPVASGEKTITKPDMLPNGAIQLIDIDLQNKQVNDAALAGMVGLKWLERLNLYRTLVSDAGLIHLDEFTNLTYLNIAGTRITEATVRKLRTLHKLKFLSINELAAVTPSVVLDSLPANCQLTQLWLHNVTDADLEKIAKIKTLETIGLTASQRVSFSDQSVVQLAKLPSLTSLTLTSKQIVVTDATLDRLPELKKLTQLAFNGIESITDASLDHLAALTNLKRLTLIRTNATAAGVAALQSAVPDCKIEFTAKAGT